MVKNIFLNNNCYSIKCKTCFVYLINTLCWAIEFEAADIKLSECQYKYS